MCFFSPLTLRAYSRLNRPRRHRVGVPSRLDGVAKRLDGVANRFDAEERHRDGVLIQRRAASENLAFDLHF